MSEVVSLNHGSGGKQSHELISSLFARIFEIPEPLTDSAVLPENGYNLSFTTDSYVVDPLFFPGGNIGNLAICGTVNDLAVTGAVPKYISASFIIEEGFPLHDLELITASMADEAKKAGVRIVTGDTKVVDRGKCDKLFITTAGAGYVRTGFETLCRGSDIRTGDKLIVNGPLGNHAIAVLGARNNLNFSSSVISDCASLNHLIKALLDECREIRFMRDLTRGGLTAVLHEIVQLSHKGITLEESSVPVDEPVRGLCEVLGFDPCYLANEGKIVIVAGEGEQEKIISILKSHPLGKNSAVIGTMTEYENGLVIVNTSSGGKRILDLPAGIQLPRIC
jgi:hydrogenase expression/formation protein HypE